MNKKIKIKRNHVDICSCDGFEFLKKIQKFRPTRIGASQLGIRAQVNDYLRAWVGVSTSIYGYWLVITEYRELGVQNT